ncbi:hypothetical protein [Longirhabdus pacifica]|uniref:hypothetical protein n=1 Tax=Longirhabdus pacifica TaxID=2305227 RepID=UPI001008A7BD|nr:hypothetical protein [Longirhabdus pacifica]
MLASKRKVVLFSILISLIFIIIGFYSDGLKRDALSETSELTDEMESHQDEGTTSVDKIANDASHWTKWNDVDDNHFYRITDNKFEINNHYYLLNGAKLTNKEELGGEVVFTFKVDGADKKLHLQDLIYASNYHTDYQKPLAHYWVENETLILKATEDDVVINKEVMTNIPLVPTVGESNTIIPEHIEAIIDSYGDEGSGDLSLAYTARQINNVWHVLLVNTMYIINDQNDLQKIGELPVNNASSFNNSYGISYSAEDFIQVDNQWFVADTYGDRLVKLDAYFNVIAEVELLSPYAVQWSDDDTLIVESLAHTYEIDNDLNIVNQKTRTFEPFSGDWNEKEIDENLVYVDNELDILWQLNGGTLTQYNQSENTLRTYYIETSTYMLSSDSIIPYKDKVLVLTDHQIYFFERNGDFEKVIEMDKERYEDYRWEIPSSGSYVLLEEADLLYIVIDSQVIEVDLKTEEMRTIFSHYRIGYLLYDQNKLYFSLVNDTSRGKMNQLITYDLDQASLERKQYMGDYETYAIIDQQMVFKQRDDTLKQISLDEVN